MNTPNDLTKEQLVAVVERILAALYATEYVDAKGRPRLAYDRNKVWGAETIEAVDEALVDAGLAPEDDPE